ncbi:condensation domain-containing protein [Nonomuraea sp. NPDC005650]|uniref:condensation domain-containing protein n=1 Tax=Nonomuraea sp. NPDC005650 TaxID=3157045 RepID=UPI0033B0C66E
MTGRDRRSLLARLMSSGMAPFPLSYGQQAMWFMDQLRPEASIAYNVSFAWAVHGRPDLDALRRAFEWLVARHAILRTRYVPIRGIPLQHVDAEAKLEFRVVDVERDADVGLLLTREAARRFDLASGPLLRVLVVRRPAGRPVLLWSSHHIAIDGWSIFQIMEELGHAYTAYAAGERPPGGVPTVTYADFVAWQAALVASAEGRRMKEYWQRTLREPPAPLALPTDRPRPALQGFNGDAHAFSLGEARSAAVARLAGASDTTVYTTLLAAFQVLLGVTAEQDRFLLGTWAAGRSHQEFASVVGDFVNAVVLKADIGGGAGFREIQHRCRASVLEALAHQDYPFPLLVERLPVPRDPSRSPLFDVAFTLRSSHRGTLTRTEVGGEAASPLGAPAESERGVLLELGALTLSSFPLHQGTVCFDLEAEFIVAGTEISGVFRYNTDLFDTATVAGLAERYLRVIDLVTADPDGPVRVVVGGDRLARA